MMRPHTEPNGIELQIIQKYIDFTEKTILEIGCGNGRLTYQLAASARKVVAIDPDDEEITQATNDLPENLRTKIAFHMQSAENLSFTKDFFDIIVFSYSLCCMQSLQSMQASLKEVLQRLEPDGFIVILQPPFLIPFKRGIINYLISKIPNDLVHDDAEIQNLQEAWFAIKHATLVEKTFDFIAEEEFSFEVVHNTIAEALDFWVEKWGPGLEAYEKLDAGTKAEIASILDARTTPQGVFFPEKSVLTILRKPNQ